MKWEKLTAKNFLSFEEFTLNLDNRGLILIEGKNLSSSKFESNGSGKSSLLEPIVYAIYDTTSKGIKADGVVNRHIGKNTVVILEGRKGDDLYRIERYRKHYKHKNKVRFFVNDQEITEKSAADTNAAIQKVVGMDYGTFINSIMFSQGSGAGRFAIATDKEKKEILENLAKLQIYAKAQEIAKTRVRAKEAEIVAKNRDGERLNWELAQVDTLEQQDRDNYESTKNMIKQKQDEIKANIEATEKYTRDNVHIYNEVAENIERYKAERDALTSVDISGLSQSVNQLTTALNNFTGRIQQLEYQKAELVKKYQQLKTNTNCPVCGNLLDTAHRDKEMADIKEKLKPIMIEIQDITNNQIPPTQAEYDRVYPEYVKAREASSTISKQYQDYTTAINEGEAATRRYEQGLQSYRNQLESIKATIESLKKVPEPVARDKEREDIKAKLQAQKEAILALQKEQNHLENAVKVYSNSGVKSHVLDLITPILNTNGNKYLATLSGSDMELTFSTQTEKQNGEMSDKFDVQLTNLTGGDNYKANSEGEKKRADLSIALALQDLVMSRSESSTNFALYDEVFDALDSVGAENVIQLLKERLKTVGTILVISHNEHLKPLFDKSIYVTKQKNGISTLFEGEETT